MDLIKAISCILPVFYCFRLPSATGPTGKFLTAMKSLQRKSKAGYSSSFSDRARPGSVLIFKELFSFLSDHVPVGSNGRITVYMLGDLTDN